MEYCDCGSLANIISKTSEPLEEDLIKIIMKSALLGLAYLHDKRMIHRDIKADNILITSDGKAKLGLYFLSINNHYLSRFKYEKNFFYLFISFIKFLVK